jgi:hypothetical protein
LIIYNTTTNQLQVNTGTPAAPVWTVTNPTNVWNTVGNTGTNPTTNFIGTTDNQPLVMRTNNAEHLRIDTTGWVGLDDATPRAPLSFASVTGSKIRFWDNGSDTATYGIGLGPAQLNYHIDQNPSAVHRFLAGGDNEDGTELMRIQANGNVGINTLVPAAKLDVNGTARINGSTGTAANVMGRNAAGDISNVAIGTGLNLTGGTLSATVSTPGWALGGNTGTNGAVNYIGTTDAQPLVLRTNAAEHVRITSGGNVGINNGAPLSPLSFASAIEPKISLWDGGSATNNIGFGVSSAQLNYHVTPGSTHAFFAGGKNGDGTELMRIQSDGNVGISDTTPRAPLSFASVLGAKIRFWDNGSDTATYGIGLGPAQLNYHIDQNPSAVHRFLAGGGNEDGTELMRIQANGNVGINTLVPAAKLDVNGTARISGSAGTPTAITGRNATGDIGNIALGAGLSLTGGTLSAAVSTPGWALTGNAGTNPAINYIGTADAQPLVFRTNAAERMRVLANGNVGIGTTAPAFNMHVSGNTGVTSAVENTSSANGEYAEFRARMTGTVPADISMFTAIVNGNPNNKIGGLQTTTANDLVFRTGISGFGPVERMRIDTLGNVGIGTNDPAFPLQVAKADFGPFGGLALTDNSGANATNFTITPGYVGATAQFGVTLDVTGEAPISFVDSIRPAADARFSSGTASARWLNTWGYNADFAGTARIAGSAGTPASIMGRDVNGNVGNITLGANLSLAGGVLSATGGGTAGWGLSGNAGTNPASNFIGTTDAQPLVFSTGNSEKMRIGANGFIGIGTSTINSLLDIGAGDVTLTQGYAIRWGNSVNAERIFQSDNLGYPGQNLNLEAREYMVFTIDRNGTATNSNTVGYVWNTNDSWTNGGTPTELMRLTDAGNLGLGIASANYKLDVVGDINASANVRAGGVILTSDARLKRNICNTQHGLSTIMKLNPVEYEKKNTIQDSVYNRHEIGFIAQEVAKVLPSLVTEGKDADKTLAVSYTELIPVLTKAIQEQQTQIENQHAQITAQDQKISALVAENKELKENKVATAQLMERVKQMEQMMGINEIEGTSKVAGK